ncbi:hypothetical protein HRbin02_01463 [Candidatus Calditenuaceae archaeon HR02]|nr:hypothetical protein HRbin02_01463 [Candidatus Calditenuaceae archaeon HR02]
MTLAKYFKISGESPAYIYKESAKMLRKVDSILFDCDGVLIDTRESYDMAIVKTVSILFEKILNLELMASTVSNSHIYLLRSTGGFNNDTDTAYVLSLWLFTGLPRDIAGVIQGLDSAVEDSKNPQTLLEAVSQTVDLRTGHLQHEYRYSPPPLEQIISETMRRVGDQVLSVADLEQTLREFAGRRGQLELFETFRHIIGRPGSYGEGLLETLFCDIYYGPENVRLIFGRGNFFDLGPGMYLKERVNVKEDTLKLLAGRFGVENMGIVSGRDRFSTEIVLGDLMKYFNADACVFLADEYRQIGEVVKKPSPYGIVKAVIRMGGATSPMYLGNSAEDFFMSRSVEKYGYRTLFAAVVGLAPNPAESSEFFASLGCDAILLNPDDITKVFGVV